MSFYIENVFTKVIRISNVDSLGDRIVVQGGTFENDAVLCALEQYLGREVIRAPYPGIMGAIGVALITKEQFEAGKKEASFIGTGALDEFFIQQGSKSAVPVLYEPLPQNDCEIFQRKFLDYQ